MNLLSATAAAERFGWSKFTYAQHESGTRGMTLKAAEKYGAAFRVSPGWLLTGETAPQSSIVSIMGYIGAGAEIMPEFEQLPPEGLFEVELPFPMPDDMIGFEVRGDSMLPRYDEGDAIVVYRDQRRPLQSFLGEEAAVRTDDGRRFLKRIERGSDQGTVNLASFNARTIESVRLEWIGEIWVTLRSGQLRRIEQRERAAALRRTRRAKNLAAGTGDLLIEDGAHNGAR